MIEILKKEQRAQENEYFLPYHWFSNRSTYEGRTYFGYMDICHSFLGRNIENLKILDAGCGDGRFLGELKRRGAKNLYGFDYSDRAISFAKIFLPETDLIVADLTKLPYGDDFFDVIFLVEVLEHIDPKEIEMVIKNLKRILKKEGELIITVPSEKTSLPPKHFQHFTEIKIKNILKDDFEIVEMVGQGKVGFSLLGLFYKFLDNRFWIIRPLAKYYNKKIWPKYFNRCSVGKGERIVTRCRRENW